MLCSYRRKRQVVHFDRLQRCPPGTRVPHQVVNRRRTGSLPPRRPTQPVGAGLELVEDDPGTLPHQCSPAYPGVWEQSNKVLCLHCLPRCRLHCPPWCWLLHRQNSPPNLVTLDELGHSWTATAQDCWSEFGTNSSRRGGCVTGTHVCVTWIM